MKTKITALLLAVATTFALAPKQAQAGDKEVALIGGLLGGIIIGSAIANSQNDQTCHDTAIVVAGDRGRPPGYWDYRTVRVWVPGYWEVRYVRGCRDRVYVPGYWDHRRERHWVSHNRRDHRR